MGESSLFRYRSHFPCSRERLYSYHARSGALERLLPPWERTSVVSRKGTISPGGEVVMRMYAGIIPYTWIAHHVENRHGEMFRDIMHKGPLAKWSHSHIFEDNLAGCCLEDRIEWALPFHKYLPEAVKKGVVLKLERTFQHREKVLQADMELHEKYAARPMRVLISGASGVLGRALVPLLTTGGHTVFRLVRRKPVEEQSEIFWNPENGEIGELPPVDAVIHLAGEYIGLGRWNESKKKAVVESREKGTSLVADACLKMEKPPQVFLCASAVGYYGNTGTRRVSEDNDCGSDFISEVCRVWEESAERLQNGGVRTVLMRIGVSLTPRGGALQRMLAFSALGFLRRFGSGKQYISWISIDDTVSAIYHAMCCDTLSGPVNIAAPNPVTNSDFLRTLAEVTGKPLTVPVPASLLKAVYGQMATEILLSGCSVSCEKLVKSGFRFRHETLEKALRDLLGRFALKDREEEEVSL